MKYDLTTRLSRFLLYVIVILSAADVFITLTSPWWINSHEFMSFFGIEFKILSKQGGYWIVLSFTIACGILAFGIFYEAFRILLSIYKGNPFCIRNAKSFYRAGIFAFLFSAAFFIKMFFSPSVLTIFCMGVFILFGLFMLILSQLFFAAVQIKADNELTI